MLIDNILTFIFYKISGNFIQCNVKLLGVLFLLQTGFLIYFAFLDLKYRSMPRYYILLLWVMTTLTSFLLYGSSFDFWFGLFYLQVIFFVINFILYVFTKKHHFGSIDLLGVPCYSCLFGIRSLFFIILYYIVKISIMKFKFLKKILELYKVYHMFEGFPMLVGFIISYLLLVLLLCFCF